MSEVPVQDFFEIASHKVALACHNLWVHSQSKCVQIQSILIKYENQELHNVPEQDLWACKNFKNASEFHSKQLRLWMRKSWNCTQNFFFKTCRQRTSKMRLNFTANSFIFGRTNHGIAPTTFSVKLAGRELTKCVWISWQTSSFLDAQIVELRPELYL